MILIKYFSTLLFLNSLIFSQFLYNEKDTLNGDHYNYLDVNNVFLWTSNNGLVGFDPIEELNQFKWYNELNEEAVIPFGGGLQWSCIIDGEIRTNGAYYNRCGLQAGSIISPDNNPLVKLNRYRVYKISNNWQKFIPGKKKERFKKDIEEWPVVDGAPWFDRDYNNIYEYPIDQPKFLGDQMLFSVSNDLNPVRTTFFGRLPIGLEIRQTVFGFRQFLRDVVFLQYTIINKSGKELNDFYFSYYFANPYQNYNERVGCDTLLNLGFVFGDNVENIPASGIKLLQGPIKPASNYDTAKFRGNALPGYKNIGITGFVMEYCKSYAQGIYAHSIEVHNYHKGKTWGGNQIINPVDSTVTTFMFSGEPGDTTTWIDNGYFASYCFHDHSPAGRNFFMSSGPFTMAPDDTQEVVYALIAAQGEDNFDSIRKLKLLADKVQYFYDHYTVDDPEPYFEPLPEFFALSQNYPNPFNPTTTIKFAVPGAETTRNLFIQTTLKVYDILGREVATLVNKNLTPGNYEVEFNAEGLSSGVYYYCLEAGSYSQTKKMILLR